MWLRRGCCCYCPRSAHPRAQGSVWARLGAKVTVVEYLDRIVPSCDLEIAQTFQKALVKQGFKFVMGTKVASATPSDKGVQLKVGGASLLACNLNAALTNAFATAQIAPAKGGAEETLDADYVLVATGRRPFTANLGLEKLNIAMKGPFVQVNDHWQTNVPSIYAIGDVTPGPMLAHKAEEEGETTNGAAAPLSRAGFHVRHRRRGAHQGRQGPRPR
jgi:dihydrolipoamide dehydrogenase